MLTSPRLTQVTYPRLFCTEDQVQSLEPTANLPLSYPVKKWPTAKMIEIRSWSLLHRIRRIRQGRHEPMHDNGLGNERRFEEACRTYHSRRCTTDPAKGQKCWWCRRLAEPWGGSTYGDVPALRHAVPAAPGGCPTGPYGKPLQTFPHHNPNHHPLSCIGSGMPACLIANDYTRKMSRKPSLVQQWN